MAPLKSRRENADELSRVVRFIAPACHLPDLALWFLQVHVAALVDVISVNGVRRARSWVAASDFLLHPNRVWRTDTR